MVALKKLLTTFVIMLRFQTMCLKGFELHVCTQSRRSVTTITGSRIVKSRKYRQTARNCLLLHALSLILNSAFLKCSLKLPLQEKDGKLTVQH